MVRGPATALPWQLSLRHACCAVHAVPCGFGSRATRPVFTCRYGFNSGSTQCFTSCMPIAAKVAANTTIAIGSCGLTNLLLAVLLGMPGARLEGCA